MEYSKLRNAGVLAHVSSLPSNNGVASFGKDALSFIDIISASGFSFWQVLPLCPIGSGNSPYSSVSAFAGNELFIDLESLCDEGYLDKSELPNFEGDIQFIDWDEIKAKKLPVLKKAVSNIRKSINKNKKLLNEYEQFKNNAAYWLEDYAVFSVSSSVVGSLAWNYNWPDGLKKHDKNAIATFKNKYNAEIEECCLTQFIFRKQWQRVKSYANKKGIKIIGDLPYCSGEHSAEVWANTNLFYFDKDLRKTKSVGVPPDAFSSTGQLWGNPQYKWSEHQKEGYRFWIERIKANLTLFDYLRLDHFRGFESSWTVGANEQNAINGKWEKSGGYNLFDAIYKTFGFTPEDNPFIAEDLGVITEEVDALRKHLGMPSTRVMEFAFNHHNRDPHLPHMWDSDVVGYLGTHDNNTLIGWWQNDVSEYERDNVRRYFYAGDESAPWYMMRSLVASRAPVVLFTLQDLMFLPSEYRLNKPGTVGNHNWSWKATKMFDAPKFKELLERFARIQ
ncbi:MAG: 4-alpha-glucanotransferase [Sphaerochaetaceae bacterium]|nr:4-alpha-glucanotransferase [Sphaerochaetaceae bacterium]